MKLKRPTTKIVLSRILFVVVTCASISLSQAEDQNALHKECFRQNKGRSCVRLGTTLWQDPTQRTEARAAFIKGCELKEDSACTLKEMGVSTSDSGPGSDGAGASVPENKKSDAISGIVETSPAHYRVSRKTISKYAGDLQNTLSTAKMSKQMSAGKVVGYRFDKIDKDSVFTRLGFLPGDVILRVNDQTIATPEDAMTLLPTLLYGSTDHYVIHMGRRGLTNSQRYDIVE